MRRVILFLRGAVPLALVAIALVAVPALLSWWLLGEAFGWPNLLAGVACGAVLLALGGLTLGWAMGRYRKQ
jgi:membrane protein required for beta-lactamase induction